MFAEGETRCLRGRPPGDASGGLGAARVLASCLKGCGALTGQLGCHHPTEWGCRARHLARLPSRPLSALQSAL